jgi:hypothetical protein
MSTVLSWDPLDAADDTDKEVVSAAKKREIKNILKSYVSNYDPFSELIQNALDAVEKRAAYNKDFSPKVQVIINLAENSVEVVDNGCGFEEAEFRAFLAPSISFKTAGKTRGNKGVGVTYIAYGFNRLAIRTKNQNFKFEGVIRRGREWIEDNAGTVSRPKVEETDTKSEWFDHLDQGTSFKLEFSGPSIRPSNLSWYQASTPEQWLYLLLTKTPLGLINLANKERLPIKFDLIVTDREGKRREIVDRSIGYKYPHEEISASQRLAEVVSLQQKALDAGKDVAKAIASKKNSNGVYEYYGPEDIKKFTNIDKADYHLIDDYQIHAYGYFAYSTEVWDQLNDKKAMLRKGLRVIRGGLQQAVNGMPQGELITIPLTKAIGHQNQAHVIVHFEGAEPDYGRKGLQPELKELAEQISVGIVRQLSARRDILKSDSGAQADIDKEVKVHEWLRDQEDHEKSSPLVLTSDKFFVPTKKVSLGSTPRSEQDVIVLFNQLIAGGVIRGIRLLGTSQTSQYDGVFRYIAEEPLANYVFDEEANPLGVLDEQLTKPYVSQPKILEYKYGLDGLIHEMESGYKHETDVNLCVFWEMGSAYQREYTATSYLDFENVHHRPHHGLTHLMTSGNSSFHVICLRELMDLLNDPSASQAFQKAAYGDSI